jgi:hypothetical protein
MLFTFLNKVADFVMSVSYGYTFIITFREGFLPAAHICIAVYRSLGYGVRFAMLFLIGHPSFTVLCFILL